MLVQMWPLMVTQITLTWASPSIWAQRGKAAPHLAVPNWIKGNKGLVALLLLAKATTLPSESKTSHPLTMFAMLLSIVLQLYSTFHYIKLIVITSDC